MIQVCHLVNTSDLAKLYQCANGAKTINLAVKRHINRIPERFMFQLTKEETMKLCSRFQFETLNDSANLRGSNIKYLRYAFTEQDVAMLATVLRTKVAEEISIKIMDAFVAMRNYINSNKSFLPNRFLLLEDKVDNNTKRINELFDKFDSKDIVKDYILLKNIKILLSKIT